MRVENGERGGRGGDDAQSVVGRGAVEGVDGGRRQRRLAQKVERLPVDSARVLLGSGEERAPVATEANLAHRRRRRLTERHALVRLQVPEAHRPAANCLRVPLIHPRSSEIRKIISLVGAARRQEVVGRVEANVADGARVTDQIGEQALTARSYVYQLYFAILGAARQPSRVRTELERGYRLGVLLKSTVSPSIYAPFFNL